MQPIDVHPLAPRQEKSLYEVRKGHGFGLGYRALPEGTIVLAHDSWVAASAKHILRKLDEPEPKPESEPVETEAPAANVTDGRTKKARSPRRK